MCILFWNSSYAENKVRQGVDFCVCLREPSFSNQVSYQVIQGSCAINNLLSRASSNTVKSTNNTTSYVEDSKIVSSPSDKNS